MFSKNLESRGVKVHWAKDAQEFNEIVLGILKDHNVKKMVKSKSMLTEECEMNPYLEQHGIDVVETDLGERIIQLLHQKPSHIVMPAIHLKREEVGRMFEEKGISKETGNYDPTYLTRCARHHLRDQFMEAGAGMTGCNFGVAATGDCVVCTNEGNADMTTSMPKLHIVAMGIEKLVPDYQSLAVFQRLLCRCGTGQPTTTYTSHFRQARPGAEMHVVLVDNGRSDILADKDHWQTLKCMRCGACMNTCPVNLLDIVLNSDFVRRYNPLTEFLESLPEWKEGDPDYIGELSRRVVVKNYPTHFHTQQEFTEMFRKWIVGMVACWVSPRVVNEMVLILVGKGGLYKTSFFQYLLPPELRQYYANDQLATC
jgi:iron-sulfur cluster protein